MMLTATLRANATRFLRSFPLLRRTGTTWKLSKQFVPGSYVNFSNLHMWPSMTFWPEIKVDKSHGIACAIEHKENPQEILDLLSNREYRAEVHGNAELLRFMCRRLAFILYIDCAKQHPYKALLKEDIHLAFRQLYPTRLFQIAAPVLQHDQFPSLLELIYERTDDFSTDQRNEMLVLLFYVGVDIYDSRFRNMLLKAKRELPGTDWNGISNLLRFTGVVNRSDFRLYSRILQHMRNELGQLRNEHTEISGFLASASHCARYCSPVLLYALSEEICRIFDDLQFFKSGYNIAAWLKAGSAVHWTQHIERRSLRLKQFSEAVQFSIYEVGQVLYEWKSLLPRKAPRLLDICDYVDKESCENLELKDLLVVAGNIENVDEYRGSLLEHSHNCLQKILTEDMDKDDLDLIAYPLLFAVLKSPDISDDLRELLVGMLMEVMPSMVKGQTYSAIFHTESERKSVVERIENIFKTTTLYSNRSICQAASYVLANYSGGESAVLEKLLQILPNCDEKSIGIVLNGLCQRRIFFLRSKYDFLHNSLRIVLERSIYNGSLKLNRMLYAFNYTCRLGDLKMATYIMSEIEKQLVDEISLKEKFTIMDRLIIGRYYSPICLEFLCQSLLRDDHETTEYKEYRVRKTLEACIHFGHNPKCMPELLDLVLEMLKEARRQNRWNFCYKALLELCCMNVIPLDEVKNCFTPNALQAFIGFLQAESDTSKKHRLIVDCAQLNYHVLLMHPHIEILRVPEGFRRMPDRQPRAYNIDEEIYVDLLKLFGGVEFVKRSGKINDVFVNFEVILDSNGKPLRAEKQTSTCAERRIAIITISDNLTAFNDKNRLLRSARMRKLYLQRMGYEVVFLLRNHWKNRREHRIEVLRNFLFQPAQHSEGLPSSTLVR